MGEFLNDYVKDLNVIVPLGIGAALVLIIFSVLYNHWMGAMGEKKEGYIAILVAVGNFVTLLIVSIFSWKAALITLVAFIASGTVMIIGDVYRSTVRREMAATETKKQIRRKPLPYVAGRLMADAFDELVIAERMSEQMIEKKEYEKVPLVLAKITKSLRFLSEAKNTEGE